MHVNDRGSRAGASYRLFGEHRQEGFNIERLCVGQRNGSRFSAS